MRMWSVFDNGSTLPLSYSMLRLPWCGCSQQVKEKIYLEARDVGIKMPTSVERETHTSQLGPVAAAGKWLS